MIARRFLVAFLVVTVPGTVLLGLVTLSSLDALAALDRESAQIERAIETTRDVVVPLTQAGAPLREYLSTGAAGHRQEFDRTLQRAADEMATCATASCHGSSRTPQQMADVVTGEIERLQAKGRAVFTRAPGGGERAGLEAEIDALVVDVGARLARMTTALTTRQDTVRRQSRALVERTRVVAASLTVAVVLAASGAAVVLARRISRPVSALLEGTRRVIAGECDAPVSVAGGGELAELAASFTAMVREIGRQRRREAERLSSLGRLAAGVAHELNNPLTSIVMNTHLLLEECGEAPALARELRKIDDDAARCQRIIDDLRAFARGHTVRKVPCTVAALVDDAVGLASHELQRRGARVQRDLDPSLPKIALDPERMTRVLVNLLVNAAQAMPGGGAITVRARHDEGALTLQVADCGVGIAPADRARIFDPFFTTKRDGIGLGLSISHGIVHEHGGRIEVASRTRDEAGPDGDTGTTMTVILPAADPA